MSVAPHHIWYLAASEKRAPFTEYAELIETVGDQYSLTLTEGTDAEWGEFALAQTGAHESGLP